MTMIDGDDQWWWYTYKISRLQVSCTLYAFVLPFSSSPVFWFLLLFPAFAFVSVLFDDTLCIFHVTPQLEEIDDYESKR